jgi:hypothetical protein
MARDPARHGNASLAFCGYFGNMPPVQICCTPKENDTMNRALKALFLLLVLVGTYASASVGPKLNDGNPPPRTGSRPT